jgi:hypothetical protein
MMVRVHPTLLEDKMSEEKWFDPNVVLPSTDPSNFGYEVSKVGTARVPVIVKLDSNKVGIFQFRRYLPSEPGGVFCGFSGSVIYVPGYDFDEFVTQFQKFGDSTFNGRSNKESVVLWRELSDLEKEIFSVRQQQNRQKFI